MVNLKDVFGKWKGEKKISPAIPCAAMTGLLVGTIGGGWVAVGAAFLLGSWVGYLFSIWLTGRQA